MYRGRGRCRGREDLRGGATPRSGRHYTASVDDQSQFRRRNPEQERPWHVKNQRFVYVEKGKVGQCSAEPMSGGSKEVKCLNASDVVHEGNNPLSSAQHGSEDLHVDEDVRQDGQILPKVAGDSAVSCEFSNKIDISCQHNETSPINKNGGKGGPSPIKSPNTSASDAKSLSSEHLLSAQLCSEDSYMGEETTPAMQNLTKVTGNSALARDFSNKFSISNQKNETSPPYKYSCNSSPSPVRSLNTAASDGKPENSEISTVHAPFDICPQNTSAVKLKPSLLVTNRERRNEIKRKSDGQNGSILRPGMVLLRRYISLSDQVKIVKRCRELGLGTGGFYQPGYRDGAKLHLNMMCLGKNWDPETSKYGDVRPIDGVKPPVIPNEFYEFVENAIKDSHSLIGKELNIGNAEGVLPWMRPDICLVNFYSANGRLGLHQDRDESSESLRNCLPVVSFSIGDTADFLFGDQRDVDAAQKITLESGDILIFGGQSRHVFHGVAAIHSNSAPKALLEETNLRPGRLNLTFRQY
ncbi:hypothetical protein UlMin_015872 [Ulmus minor]